MQSQGYCQPNSLSSFIVGSERVCAFNQGSNEGEERDGLTGALGHFDQMGTSRSDHDVPCLPPSKSDGMIHLEQMDEPNLIEDSRKPPTIGTELSMTEESISQTEPNPSEPQFEVEDMFSSWESTF